MRKLTQALLLAGLIATPVLAFADEAPAPAPEASPVTGNMAFTSHYIFRGLSQSWDRPVVQAGLDYAHPSGFYLGTWGSGVSDKIYNNASMEWDFYGGYNGKVNDDLSWGVGAITIWYPGGHANNAAKTKYDTSELNAQINYKILNLKYSYTLTNLFGLDSDNPFNQPVNGDTKGSQYLEANVNYEVADKWTLGLHLGHRRWRTTAPTATPTTRSASTRNCRRSGSASTSASPIRIPTPTATSGWPPRPTAWKPRTSPAAPGFSRWRKLSNPSIRRGPPRRPALLGRSEHETGNCNHQAVQAG